MEQQCWCCNKNPDFGDDTLDLTLRADPENRGTLGGQVIEHVARAEDAAQRLLQVWAERKAASDLAQGKRTSAMGAVAATSLGRPWLMAAVVLITCIIDREVGLAAAALLVLLFTVNLATRGLAYLLGKTDQPEEAR